MNKQNLGLFLTALLISSACVLQIPEVKAASAIVPLSVTVNGSLVISDADNDTMAGKDPTKNVNISVTPDLGTSNASGSANFRIRTNRSTWRVTAQRTASDNGGTGIADADVKLDVSKSAGSNANANSGVIASPFTAQTDLSSVSTSSAVDVVTGSAKTSSAKDGNNSNNWFQLSTTYSIAPDFFYTPGTYSTTITYSLVSP